MTAYVLAHVSDFHVSTFGDSLHERALLVKRSARVADTSDARWDVAWEEAGWRVLRPHAKRGKAMLVDLEGYAHALPPARKGAALDPIERAAAHACRLEARRAATLASTPPTDGALAVMLEATPHNTSLRLLRAARAIPEDVDAVVATGDLTDDGVGYEVVETAFARWRARGRFFAVPGNHDAYLFPIAGSTRPRPTHASKRAAWCAFAERIGLPLDASGAWSAHLGEAHATIVGLDTCARKQRAFYRHNGAVGPAQLALLHAIAQSTEWRHARHRIVLLHHHVVPLPHGVGKRAPTEIGMRLDDARALVETLNAIGATLVMHGHRHLSEARRPAGCTFELLAAPSLTLGCKSGDAPSYWRVELGERTHHATRVHVPFEAVVQDNGDEATAE
jgi:3',5'-cyclic AMP phosphodiesterase CpdA